jgi:NitT/TauT family transport system ATP-binding protein
MKLSLEGIAHGFLGRPALEDVSLVLNDGEIVSLVGPSGCGKTTLLAIAVGLIEPLRGRVRRLYNRHAMVFQEPRLLPWLSARDNIAYGLVALGLPRARRRDVAAAKARAVGLNRMDWDKYPAELSGGMRQRVAIARALAVRPDVMFLDEPFSSLDVGLKRTLQDLVVRMAREEGFSGLFVTHDLAEAVRVADRVAVLSGRQRGIVEVRTVPGRPGERDERTVFDLVERWSRDAVFAELFDGEGRGV